MHVFRIDCGLRQDRTVTFEDGKLTIEMALACWLRNPLYAERHEEIRIRMREREVTFREYVQDGVFCFELAYPEGRPSDKKSLFAFMKEATGLTAWGVREGERHELCDVR